VGLLLQIVLVAALIVPATFSDVHADDVIWSGFAFQGDFTSGEIRYPVSMALANRPAADGVSRFDRALATALRDFRNESFDLKFGELGSIGPDSSSSTALAFVLDRETISTEQFEDEYKLLIELSAQALFFDFREMAVIASYPVTLRYIDVQDSAPTDEDKAALVEALYLGDLKINAFDEFAKLLSSISLNPSVNRRIQVTSVSVRPEAQQLLPEWRQQDLRDFESSVAQEFSKTLSRNQDIPVLPYAKGYAIGNRMSMSFSEQSVFSLSIPEPDYEITLVLPKFVKVEYQKVAAGTSYVYGAFLNIKAEEPLSGHVYLDTTIKNGATKNVPAGQTTVDDWPSYEAALLGLIDKLTKVLDKPTKKWAKTHAGDKAVVAQLKDFSEVVQSCR